MQYYHNLITEKSFKILQTLKKELKFTLIGGWAVYFFTNALKSKDIDIIVDYKELEKLKLKYQVFKNERLKKYEIKMENIDIDIYLPYFSNPGLPPENILQYTIKKEGFSIPIPEILLILKQTAYAERQFSVKGEKDKIDLISLISLSDFDFKKYQEMLKEFQKEHFIEQLKELLASTSDVNELDLNRYKFAKLKKKVLAALK